MTSVVFATYDIQGVIKIPTSESKIRWPSWLPWQRNEFFLHFGWYFAFFEKILEYFFAFWISILLKITRIFRTTLLGSAGSSMEALQSSMYLTVRQGVPLSQGLSHRMSQSDFSYCSMIRLSRRWLMATRMWVPQYLLPKGPSVNFRYFFSSEHCTFPGYPLPLYDL